MVAPAPATELALSRDLIRLERGDTELLLVHGRLLRPLYVNHGREYIQAFLGAVEELALPERILAAFPQDQGLLDLLLDHGAVVPREAGPDRAVARPGNREEVTLFLLLAQACNFGCAYCLCGRRTYQLDQGPRMGREVAFRAVERFLDRLEPGGALNVVFLGGEPLLNWPLAREVMEHADSVLRPRHPDKTVRFMLPSNFSLWPDDLIDQARRHRLDLVCDLDGPAVIHDRSRPFADGRPSFATVTRHLERLRRAGIPFSLRATITSLNQDHLPEIAALHRDLGAETSSCVPVKPVNSDGDVLSPDWLPSPGKFFQGLTEILESGLWPLDQLANFEKYLSRIKSGRPSVLGCGAMNGQEPAVTASGEIYPCTYLVGNPKFRLGGVFGEVLVDEQILNGLGDSVSVEHLEACRDCPWRYICGGGCALYRPQIFGRLMAGPALEQYSRRINCDYLKFLIEKSLWALASPAA